MDEIIISVDEVKKNFESFLDIPGNTRVLFSGKFGLGKSYFLNDFFKTYGSKYDIYHLFPVNYQIHGNSDIIDLLKYDILVELFKKDKDIFQAKEVNGVKESSLLFYSWLRENYSTNQILSSVVSSGELLSDFSTNPIISLLGKLGRPMSGLLEIDKKFQEFKKEYKAGEKGLVEKYEKAIQAKYGSEPDYISSLIKEKVGQNKKDRKSVLVLDDMDRVDPEHIFRILNVLSAHFERDQENKFGFDLIIFVADETNLRHIFHHKYGPKTDFSGYIDKFFTIAPYYFDNKKAMLSSIDKIVKAIKNEEPNLKGAVEEGGFIKLFLEHIFARAIDNEIINLRQLLKSSSFQLTELRKGSYHTDHFDDNFQKVFDKAVRVAILSFASSDTFISKIESLKQGGSKSEPRMPFTRYIISMLKSLGINVPETGVFSEHWGKYRLTRTKPGIFSFSIEGGSDEELFYDLLVEYVKSKKYIKDNYSKY